MHLSGTLPTFDVAAFERETRRDLGNGTLAVVSGPCTVNAAKTCVKPPPSKHLLWSARSGYVSSYDYSGVECQIAPLKAGYLTASFFETFDGTSRFRDTLTVAGRDYSGTLGCALAVSCSLGHILMSPEP